MIFIENSAYEAVMSLREFVVRLTTLRLVPRPGDTGDNSGAPGLSTINPLLQEAQISVRWGGLPIVLDDDAEPFDTIIPADGLIPAKITRVYGAPRARQRVFIDVRHPRDDEEAHLLTLGRLTRALPQSKTTSFAVDANGESVIFIHEGGSSDTQSQIWQTTITGMLEFDWWESSIPGFTGTLFQGLYVEVTRAPDLLPPVIETFQQTEQE